MLLEVESHRFLSRITENADLVDIYEQMVHRCERCNKPPMVCVNECEIWRTKNELLQMNETLFKKDYLDNLFNAVKNDRRREIIEALSEYSRSIEELQTYLKDQGHYHSRSTIASIYVGPLVELGIIKEDSTKYRLTLYGQKFKDVLNRFNGENLLPSRNRGYEEIIIRKLRNGPKNRADLIESVPKNSLSRSIQRLTESGLISKSKSSYSVFYLRTKKVPKKKFTLTEKKVYEAIPEIGIPASELSENVGINERRTYKYLRRLRKRKLVFTRKRPRTYELTSSGRDVANFLEETEELVKSAIKVSEFLNEGIHPTIDP